MTITLFHTESHFSPNPDQIVLPPRPTAFIETSDPEEAFRLSQHGVVLEDAPWHHHPQVRLPIRSTSVGDVMQLPGGERLIVNYAGFTPWPVPAPRTARHVLAGARDELRTFYETRPGLPICQALLRILKQVEEGLALLDQEMRRPTS